MKIFFFLIAILSITLSSCDNTSTKTGTHTHDDGTVHEDHIHESEEMPAQELFEVDVDSPAISKDTSKKAHETTHSHGDGHSHKH